MFKPGKLTLILDSQAGSSSKGLRAANIWKNNRQDHSYFAVNTYLSNAAHTIINDDGIEHVHQCLSSITTIGGYDVQYLSPGCAWSKSEILTEIKQHGIGPDKLRIHPNAVIVTDVDINYEKGLVDFEGNPKNDRSSANLQIGSTLHGVGAARARRILRRPDSVRASDLPELEPFLCKTQVDIMDRLNRGESGLGEIAQGFQLSLMGDFFPRTTSRNCSVAAFLDDAMLPPSAAGPVVINFRTFPIRVNSNKYIRKSDGKILTWGEYTNTDPSDVQVITGDSGSWYSDQKELDWKYISESAGEEIFETTSLTKMPRRVATFSVINLKESTRFNNTGHEIYLSVNFMNYVDATVKAKRTKDEVLTEKVANWIKENIWSTDLVDYYDRHNIKVSGLFIGTWKTVDDSIFLSKSELNNL